MKTTLRPPNNELFHPAEKDYVTLHYEAYFKDNRVKFDSSRAKGEPIRFQVGQKQALRSVGAAQRGVNCAPAGRFTVHAHVIESSARCS